MATKAATQQKTKDTEKPEATSADTPDSPLLDLSDAAVKKLIKVAKKRGYVTMDELNAVLPSEEVTSEQIEDTMAMLSDMGINVVEDDENAEDGDREKEGDAEQLHAEIKAVPSPCCTGNRPLAVDSAHRPVGARW